MKFLVIGLGSMGKRRVRCLKRLGYGDIEGYDPRKDRAGEAAKLYGIKTFSEEKMIAAVNPDAVVISTPPDHHNEWMRRAVDNKIPAFVEASVILRGLAEINVLAKKRKVFLAPSCTLKFHPAIKDIIGIAKSGRYGKVTNFSYHSGQYLPDWHPYESIKNFYVCKKETGAAREIVAFELAWISEVVGLPIRAGGFCGKTMKLGVDIDDTYVLGMKFRNNIAGSLVVDAVARHAVRKLILNFERGQILWSW
ncbi:MAG: Gfo/Idh/MocA family oxidoreductase, partial [Elusimicrobia bacterium]|nr:Gfo/Idh/MocA family oxidoreductase [Elusimicrobiota bacterium]